MRLVSRPLLDSLTRLHHVDAQHGEAHAAAQPRHVALGLQAALRFDEVRNLLDLGQILANLSDRNIRVASVGY